MFVHRLVVLGLVAVLVLAGCGGERESISEEPVAVVDATPVPEQESVVEEESVAVVDATPVPEPEVEVAVEAAPPEDDEEPIEATTEEPVESEAEAQAEEEVEEETPERKADIVFESLSLPPTKNRVGVFEMGWMVRNENPYRSMRAVEIEYCVWDAFGDPGENAETGEPCVQLVYQPSQAVEAGETDFVTMRFQGFESVGRVEVTVLRVVYSDGVVWER